MNMFFPLVRIQGDFFKMTFLWAKTVKNGQKRVFEVIFWSKMVILRHFLVKTGHFSYFWVKKRHFRSFLAIIVTFLQNHPVVFVINRFFCYRNCFVHILV